MTEIRYIDRKTKKEEVEQVFGRVFLELLYGERWIARLFSFFFLFPVAHFAFLSRLYGYFQKSRLSRSAIVPFVKKFQVDEGEFLDPVSSFSSFNDFFIRKLKPELRPTVSGNDVAMLPADGRYLVFPDIQSADGFVVKQHKFSLEELVQNRTLAHKYARGSLVIARLCPVDCHRFFFPCHGTPEAAKEIQGPLYSVNPLAIKRNIEILAQNKRVITPFHSKNFGTVLIIEVGATYVGTIHQTFIPNEHYAKGDEKGYFSFGGSCMLLLFEPFRIQFDQDLIDASHHKIEVRGCYGESLGRALSTG
jgi:phosphatidylserine decarboxylase